MNRLRPPVGPDDHLVGKAEAPATLLEYGDYECPFCGRAHLVIEELLQRVGDEVRFAFRNFALTQVHPQALAAAQAAEAAGAQGRFWPMHSMLYENQDALEFDDLVAYAQSLDLDTRRFVEELRMGIHLPKVRCDFRSGVRSGVNGTPTFFVNGVRLDAPWSLETLLDAVRRVASDQPTAGESATP
jgi:protein-disulfide isomerase